MEDCDAAIATAGGVFTNTVTLAVAEQPLDVPVTEYVVVTVGLTVMLAEVEPLSHKKLDAPDTFNVVELPAQMAEGDALTDSVGAALTDTVTFAVDEHPFVVPVTE